MSSRSISPPLKCSFASRCDRSEVGARSKQLAYPGPCQLFSFKESAAKTGRQVSGGDILPLGACGFSKMALWDRWRVQAAGYKQSH
eukprot:3575704-Pleurochrysis_carterae.AAC.2